MSHKCWTLLIVFYLLFAKLNLAETIINAGYQEYMNNNIICNTAQDCIIICDDTESCKNASIECPANYQCDIHCNNSISTPSVCENANIYCVESSHCNVICSSSFKSCMNSTIDCPLNGDCNIECINNQACLDANIIWKYNQPNDIICGDAYKSCNGISISAGDQNKDFNFICNGYINGPICQYAIIECPQNASCNIECIGVSTCQFAIIHGPIHYPLIVNCNSSKIAVCNNITIYAQSTSSFTLIGCIDNTGCSNINIYFPPNNNGAAVGVIVDANYGLSQPTFYAINGWLDVNMLNYGGNTITGTMYCNFNYSVICIFDNTFQCIECDAPILPTNTPTSFPSQSMIGNNIQRPDVIIVIIAFNYSVIDSIILNIQSSLKNLTLSIIQEAIDNVTYSVYNNISTNINVDVDEIENDKIGKVLIAANITILCFNDTQNTKQLRATVETYLKTDFLQQLDTKQIVLIADSTVNIQVDILNKKHAITTTDALTTTIASFDDSDTVDNNVLMILLVIGCCIICCIVLLSVYTYYKVKKENIKNKNEMDVAMSTPGKKEKMDVKSNDDNGENQKEGQQNNIHGIIPIENDMIITGDDVTGGNADLVIMGEDETIGETNN